MEHNDRHNLAARATEQIKAQHLTPRPLISIIGEQVGYILLFGLCLGLLVVTVSTLSYWFRVTGIGSFLAHGAPGAQAFALSLPYTFLVFALVAVLLTLLLLRHFDISYKKPYTLLAAIIIIGAVGLGYYLEQTAVGREVTQHVAAGHHAEQRINARSLVGQVQEIQSDYLVVSVPNGTYIVRLKQETKYVGDKTRIEPGQIIRIIGRKTSTQEFEALIILDPYQRPHRPSAYRILTPVL